MVDTPANQAPVKDDAIAHLYGRKGATTGDGFVKYAENQFAHAVGLSASDKGKTPYVDANGDYARLTIGSNGAVKTVVGGLPAWLAPGAARTFLRMNADGTAVAWDTFSSTVQISKQTVSSPVASVVFTDIPATGYSRFILHCINATSAAAADDDTLYVQVSTDNGSTFKTTSGNYYNATTARTFLTSGTISATASTYEYGSLSFDLIGLGNAARPTIGVRKEDVYGVTSTDIRVLSFGAEAGSRAVVETDNAFRIITDGGDNITAGTFILYGVTEV